MAKMLKESAIHKYKFSEDSTSNLVTTDYLMLAHMNLILVWLVHGALITGDMSKLSLFIGQ